MPKKKDSVSLGEITAGTLKGSDEGLVRLGSPHPSVKYILDVLERLGARSYSTHAIVGGEPGTGKEGLAHTLHDLMHPDGGPLVTVSTAGRPEDVVSAELFGTAPQHKGERPTDVARRFGLSPGRVSQLRREFQRGWRTFCGEFSPATARSSCMH